uniref:uncharacterized protein LOC100179003 isoform X2 n=1 Tax=Ciona intestinalis TaxID=7719 RepID=UPI00089DB99F|nr:uncharacterized protein LOC100179003 isoform X2 [Ciona intestinalis]|eukprot:XP_018667704.1 uncharacterized protein LOC100179003 isoform X2 [Ciona intestinalis]
MDIIVTVLLVGSLIQLAKTENITTTEMPEIEGCRYLDAYSVDCWWKLPSTNKHTVYRLSYILHSDPISFKGFHNCEPTHRTVNSNGDIIEHCEITDGARPYSRLKIFLTVQCNQNISCSNATSTPVDFFCDPNNVLLHVPPRDFHLEVGSQQLTWSQPDRDNSLLSFVMKIAKSARYKLVYTKWTGREPNHSINNWKVWYIGNATSFYLPTLVPGAHYETKIYAALVGKHEKLGNEVWGPPSNTIKFTAPRLTIKHVEPDSTTATSTSYRHTTGPGTALPTKFAESTLTQTVSVTVTLLFLVALASVLAYYLVYKKYCCCCPNRVKIPRPLLMIELETLRVQDSQQGDGDSVHDIPDEIPMTSLLVPKNNVSNGDVTNHYSNHTTHSLRLHVENEKHNTGGRQRKASVPDSDVTNDVSSNDIEESEKIDPNGNRTELGPRLTVGFLPHEPASGDVYGENPSSPTSPTSPTRNGLNAPSAPSVPGTSGGRTLSSMGEKMLGFSNGDHFTSETTRYNVPKNFEINPGCTKSDTGDGGVTETRLSYNTSDQTMDYVIEDSLHGQFGSFDEKQRQWNDHSVTGKRTPLPDYVKHSSGGTAVAPITLNLYRATEVQRLPLKTVYCNDDDPGHNCQCIASLEGVEKSIQLLLKATCPLCDKPVHLRIEDCENNAEDDHAARRESSSSRNSVDSGYSPDSPMTL